MGNIAWHWLRYDCTAIGDSLAGFEAVPHHRVGSGDHGCKESQGADTGLEQNGWLGSRSCGNTCRRSTNLHDSRSTTEMWKKLVKRVGTPETIQ